MASSRRPTPSSFAISLTYLERVETLDASRSSTTGSSSCTCPSRSWALSCARTSSPFSSYPSGGSRSGTCSWHSAFSACVCRWTFGSAPSHTPPQKSFPVALCSICSKHTSGRDSESGLSQLCHWRRRSWGVPPPGRGSRGTRVQCYGCGTLYQVFAWKSAWKILNLLPTPPSQKADWKLDCHLTHFVGPA